MSNGNRFHKTKSLPCVAKKGGGFLGDSIKAVWKTSSETLLCISRSHDPFFDRNRLRRAPRGPVAPYNSSKVEQVILKFWIHSFSVKSLLLSPRNPPYVAVPVWGACLSSIVPITCLRWAILAASAVVVAMEINLTKFRRSAARPHGMTQSERRKHILLHDITQHLSVETRSFVFSKI